MVLKLFDWFGSYTNVSGRESQMVGFCLVVEVARGGSVTYGVTLFSLRTSCLTFQKSIVPLINTFNIWGLTSIWYLGTAFNHSCLNKPNLQ